MPVIVIWAGTDVLTVAQNPFDLAVYRRRSYDNISDGPWLVDELAKIGITSDVSSSHGCARGRAGHSISERLSGAYIFPRSHAVPFTAKSAFTRSLVPCPTLSFFVIGSGTSNPSAPDNVTFRGYVGDVPEQIDAATVLLRLPDHDGKSMLVLETLARARHVIWTHEFPGVHAVQQHSPGVQIARGVTGEASSGHSGTQFDAAATMSAASSLGRTSLRVSKRISIRSPILDPPDRNGRKYRHVAISGLGLFSAEVVAALLVLLAALSPPGRPFLRQAAYRLGLRSMAKPPEPGKPLDSLSLLALDGSTVLVRPRTGHAMLINVFATWCPPCQLETPMLVGLAPTLLRSGVDIVGVDQAESPPQVERFASTYAVPYPLYIDENSVTTIALDARVIPTTLLVDRHDIVRYIHVGPIDSAELLAMTRITGKP